MLRFSISKIEISKVWEVVDLQNVEPGWVA